MTKLFEFNRSRRQHWEAIFSRPQRRHPLARYYHKLLERRYQLYLSTGVRVLELGCGDGDLLAAVQPGFGVGIDFSRAALLQAKQRHTKLLFVQADAHALPFAATFDVVILSDLINDLWDVQSVFERLARIIHGRTRIVMNTHSRLWQLPLMLAEKLGFKSKTLAQNWFTLPDLRNLFRLTDYDIVKHEAEILAPFPLPVLSWFLNSILVKIWPMSALAVTNFVVARPMRAANTIRSERPSVSVVVAARNEAGNIASLLERLPKLGSATEIIFVEGHSKDDTREAIEAEIKKRPEEKIQLFKQNGIGKADAVWQGFAAARNDLLIILDADLSVPPEDLTRFYQAAAANKGEFINGSRLVYPMEDRAMQLANLAGNRIFSALFSWLLAQPIKDTLCGTKVLWRADYEQLRKQWPIGKLDPFGDFDLLLGATKLNLKIIDLPIRYRERTYGQTNISRWRHGLQLARITVAAAFEIKFKS